MTDKVLFKTTGVAITVVTIAMIALAVFLIGGYFLKSEEINIRVLDKWVYTETRSTTTENGMITTTTTHSYRIAARSNDQEKVYSVSSEMLYWRLERDKTYTVKVTGWWLDNIAAIR